jgi:thiol-disulfide isomerase/thioredoxin
MSSLHELRGRRVVLNVWASWCRPCIEEMPSLVRLHATQGERLRVVSVCVDEDLPALRAMTTRLGIEFPVLLDPGGARMTTWGTVKYPETWVLDEGGVVLERVIGARDWTSPSALAALGID